MTRLEPTTPRQTPSGQNATSLPRKTKRATRRTRRMPGNAYLGLGASLGSARDRERLRDRNAAERSRVEQMLSQTPGPFESLDSEPPRSTPNLYLRPAGHQASNATRGETRAPAQETPGLWGRSCPVCTSAKVVSDEVMHGGTIRLSECLHCDHRWTENPRGRWAEVGAAIHRADRATRVTRGGGPNGAPRTAGRGSVERATRAR
jgi:hypothetical protein